ncbi:hypothetical protein [Brevundimonas sp.]|uniref:hypothetical protein n=1 Tax=Brevundimonas sp. TaxID=1871086 RepID=UPI001A2E1913|nr:hypothetical protein [Brevundimonas sp.]MBJ7485255.1 hypothetical protein [Brevundimonas sp.]
MSELFRTANLVVRSVPCEDLSRWVVTFDNYGLGPGFERDGFGEPFLKAYGISAIHVLGRGNDWYQYPEIADALAAVRQGVAGAQRVMTYGSSMGGYAAVRFADAVGATSVLAFSPQYSLDPAKAGHDRRWQQDAHRIQWLEAVDGPIRSAIKPVVIYDSTGLDGWHGDRIGQDVETVAVRLPHTAHPVAVYLDEIGLLRSLVFDGLEGVIDGPTIQREARLRRRASANYYGELALRQPASRDRTGLGLARKAVELGPLNGHALSSLAALLSRQNLHQEALVHHKLLVEISGAKPDYLIPYADALVAAGNLEEACNVAAQVAAIAPHMSRFQIWAADILWKGGAAQEACAALGAALAHNPTDLLVQAKLSQWRLECRGPVVRPGAKAWRRLQRWWARRVRIAA